MKTLLFAGSGGWLHSGRMFRLLQRMDDATPRHAEGGGGVPLRLLTPVTVLAEPGETEAEAVESWARGLEWVHWLFSSVRQRQERLYLDPGGASLTASWRTFADGPMRELVSHLIQAWRAADGSDLETLLRLDHSLAQWLPQETIERSLKAGSVLMGSTRGARYQGVLGRYRNACADGRAPGHFLTVWAAVGQFFQLSVANVVGEYLRLEWSMMVRDLADVREPEGERSIVRLTSDLLQQEAAAGLKLLVQAESTLEEPSVATPS